MIKIPLTSYPDYSSRITIGGVVYVFNFRWNDAFSYWVLTVDNSAGVRIAGDIRMTTNVDLFYEKRGLGLPFGSLYLIDTTQLGLDADFDNIADFALVYSE